MARDRKAGDNNTDKAVQQGVYMPCCRQLLVYAHVLHALVYVYVLAYGTQAGM